MPHEHLSSALRRLITQARESGDPARLLHQDAVDLASQLWGEAAEDPSVAHVVGTFHWLRYLALPAGQDQADLNRAVMMFSLVYPVAPDAVPEPVRKLLAGSAVADGGPAQWIEETQRLLEDPRTNTSLDSVNRLIDLLRRIAAALPEDNPWCRLALANLGNTLTARFRQTGAREDIDEAVELCRNWVAAAPAQSSERGGVLGNLAVALRARYENFGDRADLSAAVDAGRGAVAASGSDNPYRAAVLDILGVTLRMRYAQEGTPADLNEAIDVLRQATGIVPNGHSRRHEVMHNLSSALHDRFTRSGEVRDLDDAIDACRKSLEATTSESERGHGLSNLGVLLQEKSARLSGPSELDEAITVGREALAILAEDSSTLSNLGSAYLAKYQRFGHTADLDEAIGLLQSAVNNSSSQHSDHAMYLANLGNALREKFNRFGDLVDLEAAITAVRRALDTSPPGGIARARRLTKLSSMLSDRYGRLGRLDDLDAAVDTSREAQSQTPVGNPDYAGRLHRLSRVLRNRFEAVGDLADLSEALDLAQLAVNRSTNGRERAYSLNELTVALQMRFEHLRRATDLDKAITAAREAIDITPVDHQEHAGFLDRLSAVLQLRFKETGSVADINEAVEIGQRSVAATSQGEPNQAGRMNNLALAFFNRFKALSDLADLDAAMKLGGAAVTSTPYDNPACGKYAGNLANYSYQRLLHTREPEFLDQALMYYQLAARLPTAPAFVRAMNARSWASLASQARNWPMAAKAYGITMEQLASLTGRRLTRASRQYYLERFTALGTQAAAVSLNLEDPARALSLLEQGRGILLAQALEARSAEILALSDKYPELARRLRELAGILEIDSEGLGLPTAAPEASGTPDPERRRMLTAEWDQLLEDIRRLPDFGEFLKPPTVERLTQIAQGGPVVVINVSDLRCDALILSREGVQTVPLPDLTLHGTIERAVQLLEAVAENSWETNEKIFDVLEWLWDTTASPILDYLGYSATPAGDGPLPRLWWMPTGPLSVLPIHAAGHHLERGPQRRTVPDRVISSYTFTLRALQHAQAREHAGKPRLLAVAMTQTPGERDLVYAADEVTKAINGLRSTATKLINADATRRAVLDALPGATWVHFACHGRSDPADPADSSLLLNDGPLRVRDLASLDIGRAYFAYLSGCKTAYSGTHLTDETIHIASAFQASGFAHVIGTLWPVADDIARDIAGYIYDDVTNKSSAQALHEATSKLRNEYPENPFLWAAHIHIGP
jgi:hypothetical protein